MKIKTLHADYQRKLNPELIDPIRRYESLAHAFDAWADLEEGDDPLAAAQELDAFCKARVMEILTAGIQAIRAGMVRRNTPNTPMLAIEAAFRRWLPDNLSMPSTDPVENESFLDDVWLQFRAILDSIANEMMATS